MSAFGWRGERSVDEWLFSEPSSFDFLQAVRLLEIRAQSAARPLNAPPYADVVRFRTSFDLGFAPSEIRDLQLPAPGGVPEMTIAMFGTGGPDGPLPTSFTEDILDRLKNQDTALAAFLDIFHHRLVSLLYRIHKVHRLALVSVSPDRTPAARYLLSLIGLGLPSLGSQLEAPAAMLRYAGLLATTPRSAVGLAVMLTDYFEVPFEVRQFAGEWYELDPDECTHVGVAGRNNAIGRNAVVGTRVWIQDAGVVLRVGPLTAQQFGDFLPEGAAHAALAEMVRFYAGADLKVRIQLLLRPEDLSQARLGQSRVGWTGWLHTRETDRPDDQVRVRLVARPRLGAA
ncbi:MAG TPA: type VI secretion system baseplate subunit TssG [Vicinamibacterales bacterium]|nr:type VI secretion system baseplate subunit TssG [Vicinamibacterales bacterium]